MSFTHDWTYKNIASTLILLVILHALTASAQHKSSKTGYSHPYPQTGIPNGQRAVLLKPGFIGDFLNIKEPRVIVGTVEKNSVMRIPVEGAKVKYIDVHLGKLAEDIGIPSKVFGKVPETYNLKYVGGNITQNTFQPDDALNIQSTKIVVDETGKSYFAADIKVTRANVVTEATIPYDKLNIHVPPVIGPDDTGWTARQLHNFDADYNYKFSKQISKTGQVLWHAAKDFKEGVSSGIRNAPFIKEGILITELAYCNCWPTGRNRLPAISGDLLNAPEISVPAVEPQVVGWDKFLDEIAKTLGDDINECKLPLPTLIPLKNGKFARGFKYGKTLMDFEEKKVQAFAENLKNSKVIPSASVEIAPEKIAAADICTRMCMGEMGKETCYLDAKKQFTSNSLKAVVGTLANRDQNLFAADLSAGVNYKNRLSPAARDGAPFGVMPSIGYVKGADKYEMGAGADSLLMYDHMIETGSLGRQYNNWRKRPTLEKSLCPNWEPNPAYQTYVEKKKKAAEAKISFKESPPPKLIPAGENAKKALMACARNCAIAAFNPSDFRENHLCGFDKMAFTSGIDPTVTFRGCRPLDIHPDTGKAQKGVVTMCNDEGRKVNVFNPQCTRLWTAISERSGCLEDYEEED